MRQAGGPIARIAWVMVGGFGVLGTCVALLLPPFHLPDERRHWLSAHLRAARLLGAEEVCSHDVGLERHFRLKIHFQPEKRVPPGTYEAVADLEPQCVDRIGYRFSNAFSYPGVLLVRWVFPEPANGNAALLRFRVSRLLGGILLLALLARFAQLAGRSRDAVPPGLLLLFVVPLSPLFAQQSFGVTSDVVVNGFALSLAGWLAFGKSMDRGDLVVCALLGLVAALTKPVLVPVLPAAVVLGLWLEERGPPGVSPPLAATLFRAVRRRPVFVAAMVATVAAGLAYAAVNPATLYRGGTINGAAQLAFVQENPSRALGVIGTGILRVLLQPTSLLGPLGYLDTEITWPAQLAFGSVVVLVLVAELSRHWQRARYSRTTLTLAVLLVLCLAASIGAMAFNMYLIATAVGGDTLYGLQPRYLFPQLLVALGAVSGLLRGRGVSKSPTPLGSVALPSALAVALLTLSVATSLDIVRRYG